MELDESYKEESWHDIGSIETLKSIAPSSEKIWFEEARNLTHQELNNRFIWIENNTTSEVLRNRVCLHRNSEFFIKLRPDSFGGDYD